MPFPTSVPETTIAAVRRAFESVDHWPEALNDPDRHYQHLATTLGFIGKMPDGSYALTDHGRNECGLNDPNKKFRDRILSSKTGQQIGYVENAAAFDLKGKRRFFVLGNKLIHPQTGEIAGYLNPAGIPQSDSLDNLFA